MKYYFNNYANIVIITITVKMETEHTITITFGEQVENHAGMEKIGGMRTCGFTVEELEKARDVCNREGMKAEIIYLPCDNEEYEVEQACVLVIKNMLKYRDVKEIEIEQLELNWDTKAKMRGRVVNKKARYNLCYADYEQDPDYKNGRGTIVNFRHLPTLSKLRKLLPKYLGEKAENLYAEGNYYYDIEKCYIGGHGDAERKIVIALRLGASLPLYYMWYCNSKPISERIRIDLDDGDIYVMSEKATGNDWKKRKIPTLRHATGNDKYFEKNFLSN